ncbi:hypothetical protein TNCV_3111531 [Trichonephila clavipes]|nr:hypothetical protein TNCV_3111531 [Trichonephila clavipes]
MDVCKCLMSSQYGGTLNSRRAASPLVRLGEGKRSGRPLTTSRVFFLKIGMELSKIELSPAWCSKLILKTD